MKICVIGKFGSGRTNILKQLARKYNFPFFSYTSLRKHMYGASEITIMNSVMRDYVHYLIFQESSFIKNTYKSFSFFLDDVRELLVFILNTPLWLEDIKTSNLLFTEFSSVYNEFMKKLKKGGYTDKYFYLYSLSYKKDSISLPESLAIDDADFLFLKELMMVMDRKDVIFSLSNEKILSYFDFPNLKKIILEGESKRKIREITVENKYIFIKEALSPTRAFLISRKDRILLEKYFGDYSNTDITDLIRYIIAKRYHLGELSSVPSLYRTLLDISSILGYDESYIYEFIKNHETLLLEKIENVFFSPYFFVNRFYEEVYIDRNYYNQSRIKSIKNKLFPYDFFKSEALFHEFEDKHNFLSFISTRSNKIIIFSEKNKNTDTSEPYTYFTEPFSFRESQTEVVSYSQVLTYKRCPYQYKLKYVYKLEEDIRPQAVFGKILHEILEEIFKKKEVISHLSYKMVEELLQQKMIDSIPYFRDKIEYYLHKGKKILSKFVMKEKEMFDSATTLDVEVKVESILENKRFVGVIDRIIEKDGKIYLLEYKTSPLLNGSEVLKNASRQLSVYAYLLSHHYAKKAEGGYVWMLSDNEVIYVPLREDIVKDEINSIREVIRKILDKQFQPSPSKQICKSCSFRVVCRYWRYL